MSKTKKYTLIIVSYLLLGSLFVLWHNAATNVLVKESYKSGLDEGKEKGYENGKQNGYNKGFKDGYDKAVAEMNYNIQSSYNSGGNKSQPRMIYNQNHVSTPSPCMSCDGTGLEECVACRGEGCPQCRGLGFKACFFCNGSGLR